MEYFVGVFVEIDLVEKGAVGIGWNERVMLERFG
jgi:hypothetical protein